MAKAHSSLIGGSIAERVLRCPGSWQATLRLPLAAELTSPYAEKGSFGHAVMEALLRQRQLHPTINLQQLKQQARAVLGERFYDRALTEQHLVEMILPALDMLQQLEQAYGGGFNVVGLEERVEFPGVIGAFGTIDLILRKANIIIFADFKFGQGVPVRCVYKDDDGEILNAQIAYYIAAAMHSFPELAGKRQIVGAIVQPLLEGGLDHTKISRLEITQFIEDVHAAIELAIDRDPPLRRGSWCRWCPAKVNCPQWTRAALDLSALGIVPPPAKVSKSPTPYANYLAQAKMLLDSLLLMKSEVDAQIIAYLENGGEVPGWKLKHKRKNRVWADEAVVVPALEKLGFEPHEIWQQKLQAFSIADAAAKRLGVKIPDNLRVAPASSEVVLAAADDPASAVLDHDTIVKQFQQSLKKLNVD